MFEVLQRSFDAKVVEIIPIAAGDDGNNASNKSYTGLRSNIMRGHTSFLTFARYSSNQ